MYADELRNIASRHQIVPCSALRWNTDTIKATQPNSIAFNNSISSSSHWNGRLPACHSVTSDKQRHASHSSFDWRSGTPAICMQIISAHSLKIGPVRWFKINILQHKICDDQILQLNSRLCVVLYFMKSAFLQHTLNDNNSDMKQPVQRFIKLNRTYQISNKTFKTSLHTRMASLIAKQQLRPSCGLQILTAWAAERTVKSNFGTI